jgi:hypothetical protein
MALRPILTDGLPLSWNDGKADFSAIDVDEEIHEGRSE